MKVLKDAKMIEMAKWYIHLALPAIINVSWNLILIIIAYSSGNYQANRTWRMNLKYHMDKVYADELEDLEKEIEALKAKNKDLQEYQDKTDYIIRGIKGLLE